MNPQDHGLKKRLSWGELECRDGRGKTQIPTFSHFPSRKAAVGGCSVGRSAQVGVPGEGPLLLLRRQV